MELARNGKHSSPEIALGLCVYVPARNGSYANQQTLSALLFSWLICSAPVCSPRTGAIGLSAPAGAARTHLIRLRESVQLDLPDLPFRASRSLLTLSFSPPWPLSLSLSCRP